MAIVTHIADSPAQTAAPPRRLTVRRLALLGSLLGLVALAWRFVPVFLGPNVHTVIAGKVYRSAQPYGATLPRIVRDYGIRSIVNLRGTCHPLDWYGEEVRTAQELDLAQEDINFSAGRRPSFHEIRQLVETLDRVEYPILLHCRQGADRTGLASALVLLLHTDTPYATARRQLSLWYGHSPLGRATILDEFLEMYEAWLRERGRPHDPEALRHWLLNEYRGGGCQAVFEEVTPLQKTARVGEPTSFQVRVRNTSPETWRFKPTRTAGMHLVYYLWDAEGKHAGFGHAGMFDKTVAPGECITITTVVAPLTKPGRYRLLIDMVEMSQCCFYQAGSMPHEEEIDVQD